MNCGEVEAKLLLAKTDELDAGERAGLDEHLSQCAACRRLAKETAALLGALGPAPEMPEHVREWILAQAQAQAREARKTRAHTRKLAAVKFARDLGIAVAVAVVAMVMFFRIAPPHPLPDQPRPVEKAADAVPIEEEQTEQAITQDVRRAIRELDSTSTTALGSAFSSEFERVRGNVEATTYMQTTAAKSGLEKQIGDVRQKIETLKSEMVDLALYTPKENGSSN